MTITLSDVDAYARQTDADIQAMTVAIPGGKATEITPRMLEIVKILTDEPLIAEPCVNWLRAKLAEMAMAKLNILYTPEQLDELRQRYEIGDEECKRPTETSQKSST